MITVRMLCKQSSVSELQLSFLSLRLHFESDPSEVATNLASRITQNLDLSSRHFALAVFHFLLRSHGNDKKRVLSSTFRDELFCSAQFNAQPLGKKQHFRRN